MKWGLIFKLLLAFLFIQTEAEGQLDFKINRDSLDYYLQKKDWVALFKKISATAKQEQFGKTESEIDELGKYLNDDYANLDSLERRALRVACAWVGYKYKMNFGEFDKALVFYLRANEYVADKESLDELSWTIENVISTIYTRSGDYEKADYFSKLVEKSLQRLITSKHPATPFIEKLCRYYSNLGTQKGSELKGEESMKWFMLGYRLADSIQFYAGMNSNALGLAGYFGENGNYSLGENYLLIVRNTIEYLHKEYDFKLRVADLEFQTGKIYLKKGIESNDRGLIMASIPHFKMAIDALGEFFIYKKRREFAKYYIPLAEAYMELDSLTQAEHAINMGLSSIIGDYNKFELLPNSNQMYSENSFVELFKVQAQIFQKQCRLSGDVRYLEKALRSIDLGLIVIDIIRDQVIADPSKLITIRWNKMLTNEGLKIIYTLNSLNREKYYLVEARRFFNKSKALLLDEKLQKHRLMDNMSKEDSTEIAQLQLTIRNLHSEKFSDGISTDSLNGLILNTQEKIDILLNKYKKLELQLEQQGDYIEYSINDDDIYVFSSLQGKDQFLKIGSKKEFIKLVDRMKDYVHQSGLSDDMTLLMELYQFLIWPVATELPHRFVVIPDGEIGFIPFDMLEDLEGRYLIEYCTISYAYEYNSYKKSRQKIIRNYEIYCLSPVYSDVEDTGSPIARGSLNQLPYAQIEADSIGKIFGENALISVIANKETFAEEIRNATIFHFAGHAIIIKDKAFLAFSSEGNEQNQLTDLEITLLPSSSDLVVLSACETGLGKLDIGEGIRSLGRSFTSIGASATIISLWSINDKSTSVIMTSFYRHLKIGLMKDEALRKAKLEYIYKSGKKNLSPYFWAAFIPAGDMSAMEINN